MNNFIENKYKEIKWITVIDSWKKWKNIWIFALTHWNEPVWIDVLNYLVNDFEITKKIKIWKLFLIVINIKAYSNYLKNNDINQNRFIDDNMNRISNKEFNKKSYEFNRLKELRQIFWEIDIAIDLHSVSKWNDIIWITDKKYLEKSQEIFDVENILIENIWETWAVIWDFIRDNKESYWIECWNHLWKDALNNWINNVLNLLKIKWLIDWSTTKNIKFENILKFKEEIFPKTSDFKFIKDYYWFTKIEKNKPYAIDSWKEIINKIGENIFLWLVLDKPIVWDWAWFLFEKLY